MKIQIEVTPKDINKSKKRGRAGGKSDCCPIWHALQRTVLKKEWEVGIYQLYVGDGFNSRRLINLPVAAQELSSNSYYGNWINVQPLKFNVSVSRSMLTPEKK